MEPSSKLSAAATVLLLLLFLLLLATGMGTVVVQARLCEKPSRDFKGLCMWSDKCANKCKLEGCIDGKCKYFFGRCYCTIECASAVV